MDRVSVMQIVDSLTPGGRERVAVNLANFIPRDRYSAYLCTTRYDGALDHLVAPDVQRLKLRRAFRYDLRGVYRLVRFIRAHHIRILHAHDNALFLARIASLFPPHPAIIWHDHFGRYATEERPVWLYRPAVSGARAVIAVNEPLAEWSRRRLHVPGERVWYIPNFVSFSENNGRRPTLPGESGKRVVCLANLRAQKDHVTLLQAFKMVTNVIPSAHLLLVGGSSEPEYAQLVEQEITRRNLESHVSVLGERGDVEAILKQCDVGVLSSISEGLPLALLEYGMAGLPVIATKVGQCPEVLDQGKAGILVSPGAPDELAQALIAFLRSSEMCSSFGWKFQQRVNDCYGVKTVIERVAAVYETVTKN